MRLADLEGPVLSGRTQAIALRENLEAELRETGAVELDFEGVAGISPSFADELFVRFIGNVGADRVHLSNVSKRIELVIEVVQARQSR